MDPNATLAQMRATSEAILSEECTQEHRAILAADLAEQTQALDNWIKDGGFLPAAWQVV